MQTLSILHPQYFVPKVWDFLYLGMKPKDICIA